MLRTVLFVLILVTITGCENTSQDSIVNNESDGISETRLNMYDPTTIQVGDRVGMMAATKVSIKDFANNQPLIDIVFESEPLEIEGTYYNYHLFPDGFGYGLVFVVDKQSEDVFPIHNLFEHDMRLYILAEDKIELFGTKQEGKAKVKIQGYHEKVTYKDYIQENTEVIAVELL